MFLVLVFVVGFVFLVVDGQGCMTGRVSAEPRKVALAQMAVLAATKIAFRHRWSERLASCARAARATSCMAYLLLRRTIRARRLHTSEAEDRYSIIHHAQLPG